MSERLSCEWCDERFKTEAGRNWHVRAHMREAGFVVVLRSAIKDATTDEAAFEVIKREMGGFKGIIEAIKQWKAGQ